MYGHLAFTGISLLGYLLAAGFALTTGAVASVKARRMKNRESE